MLGKKVWEVAGLAFPVALWQDGADSFSVVYGEEVTSFLPYVIAARELGCAIMHALTCDGLLDAEEG